MRTLRALIPNLPREAWVVLGGDALSAVGTGLTLPFLLVYLHRVRSVDLELAGLALSTVALAGLVGNPVGGSLSDRVGARKALVAGLIVSAAGAVALAFVAEVWHAFAAAALIGFGAAISWPAQDTLLASVVASEQRASAFSVRHATLNTGFGLGTAIAAAVVATPTAFRFEIVFLLDAVSFLAFAAIILRFRIADGLRPAAPAAHPSVGYRDVLRDKVFLRIWALTALLVAVGYAQCNAAFPAYATGDGQLSTGTLALAFAVNTFTVAVAQLVVLRLVAGRRRSRGIVLVGALWAAAWAITLAAGTLAIPVLFIAAMAVFALGETLVSPTLPPLVNDLAPERLRGRYNGAYTLAWTSGFLAGPAVAGVALAAGLANALFLALIAGCLLAAAGALRLERRLPSQANALPVAP